MEWVKSDLMREYFENEWCKPKHDDGIIFEFLVLEMMQAGLSWEIVLQKREAFRAALDGFDYRKIADYGQADIDRLMQDKGIVRNKLKLAAVVNNARKFQEVQGEFGSFDRYVWGFTGGKIIDNKPSADDALPAESELSRAVSKDLKKRGFKFAGPVICYSFLQALGIVNDMPLEYRK